VTASSFQPGTDQSNLLYCTACPPCSRRCKNNHIPADCETYFRLSNLKTLVLGPGPGNGTLYVGNDVGIFTCVTPGTLEEEPVDKCTLLLSKVVTWMDGWNRYWVQDLVPIGELGGKQGLESYICGQVVSTICAHVTCCKGGC
jgi:hypothetical protein